MKGNPNTGVQHHLETGNGPTLHDLSLVVFHVIVGNDSMIMFEGSCGFVWGCLFIGAFNSFFGMVEGRLPRWLRADLGSQGFVSRRS